MWSLQLSDLKQKCTEVIDSIETPSLPVHKNPLSTYREINEEERASFNDDFNR
jgi:hypothetical protein